MTPAYYHGLTALGRKVRSRTSRQDVLGMFDLGAVQRQFNGLKQVPVSVARVMCKNAQDVIAQARALGTAKDLPRKTDRDTVYYKLQWHAAQLAPMILAPSAIYASGDDLKEWTKQAFMESNAVEEGAAWIDSAWSRMISEIQTAVAALPAAVAKTVGNVAGSVASNLIENATGVPMWGWALVVAVVGFGAYKILSGPTGASIVGAYTGRRR